MAVISCEVSYGGKLTGDVFATQAYFNQSLKETWAEIGWHLFNNFVQKHFTKAGADEYRDGDVTAGAPVFQARSGEGESGKAFWRSYNGRKQKQFGQQLALVFSGNTRDGAKRATIYATSKGVRVAMPGLVGLNQYKPPVKKYGPHAGEPSLDLRADVLAISRREAEEMRSLHDRIMISKWGRQFLENHVVTIKP